MSLAISLPAVGAARGQEPHVRALDPFAAGALERGHDRSQRGARYLRVDLAATLSFDLQVVILAHELQHACEVARSEASSSRPRQRCSSARVPRAHM